MAKNRKAFEVALEDGRVVVLRKLTTGEMLRAMQAAGNHKGESAQAFATTRAIASCEASFSSY